MNTGIITALCMPTLTILTAMFVACTGGDAGTSHFQHPADQPGAAAEATAVSQRVGTGLSPFSSDIAPGQSITTDNPAITAPGPSAEEPVFPVLHTKASSGFPGGFSGAAATALSRPVSETVEDILEHGLGLAGASPVHIAFRELPSQAPSGVNAGASPEPGRRETTPCATGWT